MSQIIIAGLITLPFWVACVDRELAPHLIDDQTVQTSVQCTALRAPAGGLTDILTVSDTTFAALFAEDRELRLLDSSFATVRSWKFAADGARGVAHPASAAFTDSLVYVADDARNLIRAFDERGADRGTFQLNFIPRRIRAGGNQVVVSPLVGGSMPGHLLFSLTNGKVRPLGGRVARYEDFGLNTMANMVAITAFPHRFNVLHELVVPFGYLIRTGAAVASVQRVPVPVLASEAPHLRALPRARISEQNVNDLAIIAFAATENRATGGSFYVTRTGDGKRRPYRKIMVELDSLMQLQRAFHIDAHPHHLAYLHNRRALIAVDAEDRWFECPLPS